MYAFLSYFWFESPFAVIGVRGGGTGA